MAAKSGIDMTNGAILPKMLAFALPLMASSIMQLLFNASDIAVVGHFGSEHSLAAVGSTTTLISLLTNFFIGLTIGTNVLASLCLGANDFKRLARVVHTSVALGLASGLFSASFGFVFAERILIMMQTPESVLPLSLQYTRIYFFGMIPTAIYNFGAALLYAKGDTRRPLLFLMISGAINVALNLIFVIVFKMDVAGVALATVIAQSVAASLVILCLMRQRSPIRLYLWAVKLNSEIAVRILKLGIPAGFQGIVFSLSNLVIQASVNGFGPVYMAGSAASQNIEQFVWVCMNAFQPTATTFISRNIGAKKFERVNKIKNRALGCAFTSGIILGTLTVMFGPTLLSVYTSRPETIAAGLLRLHIVCGTYAICGMMDTMTGVLRGLGASLGPALISLAGACGLRLLFIATVFQISEFHTFQWLFASYPLSWIVTLAALLIYFIPVRKRYPSGGETRISEAA